MNKDLTVGKPSTVLWQFCLPLFGSVIFQQLYNIADSWVAGKFVGQNALAAVGNSYEITLIFIAFAFGCNMGCSVTVPNNPPAMEIDVKIQNADKPALSGWLRMTFLTAAENAMKCGFLKQQSRQKRVALTASLLHCLSALTKITTLCGKWRRKRL